MVVEIIVTDSEATCFNMLSTNGRWKVRPSPIGLHAFIHFHYVGVKENCAPPLSDYMFSYTFTTWGEKEKCAPPLSDYMLSYTFTTWASKKSAPLPYRITCFPIELHVLTNKFLGWPPIGLHAFRCKNPKPPLSDYMLFVTAHKRGILKNICQ